MTGIDSVKETWLSREDAAPGDVDGYRFMHMRFEAAADAGEEGIELSLFEPDREADSTTSARLPRPPTGS